MHRYDGLSAVGTYWRLEYTQAVLAHACRQGIVFDKINSIINRGLKSKSALNSFNQPFHTNSYE